MASGRFLGFVLVSAAAQTHDVAHVSGDAAVTQSADSKGSQRASLAATHGRHMRTERRQQLAVDTDSADVRCEEARWRAFERYPQLWLPCCGAEESYISQWQHAFLESGNQFSNIVDVGANVGKYSRGLMGNPELQESNYYLLEANPELVRRLLDKFTNHKNVHITGKAVDEESGTVAFYDTIDDNLMKTNGAVGQVDSHQMKFVGNIPSISMDDFAEKTPGLTSGQGLFVKVDVEGHDLKVLRGMRKLMQKQHIDAIQVEYNPGKWCKWQETEGLVKSARQCLEAEVKAPSTSLFKSFVKLFDELGYEAFLVGPHYLQLTGMHGFKFPMIHAAGTGDIFAVQKDRPWASALLKKLTAC